MAESVNNKDLREDTVYDKSTDPGSNPNPKRQPKTKGKSPRFSFEKKAALGKAPSSADLPHNSVSWGAENTWAPVDKYSIERDGFEPKKTPGNGEYNNCLAGNNFKNFIPEGEASEITVQTKLSTSGTGTVVGTTPGCMVLNYLATYGASSNDNSDPVNQSTDMLYSYVVNTYFNNNPPYWSHTDVGMHVFKVSEIVHALDFARLIITAGFQAPTQNYNMPQCYYKAIRLTKSAEDTEQDVYGAWKYIYDNRTFLRNWFNRLVDMLNTIHLPDGLPIIRSRKQLLDCWYSDSRDTEIGQLYAFAPIGFWAYDEDHPDPEDKTTWAGRLRLWRLYSIRNTHLWVISDLLQWIEDRLREYKFKSTVQWEVGNAIYNAYGSENMYLYTDMITADPTYPAVMYSEQVLTSIRNAVIVNDIDLSYEIKADPLKNKLLGRPQIKIDNDWTRRRNTVQLFWNVPLRFTAENRRPDFTAMAAALKFHPQAYCIQVHDNDLRTPCIDFGVNFGPEIITEAIAVWRNPVPGQSVADGLRNGWEEVRVTSRYSVGANLRDIFADWKDYPVFMDFSITATDSSMKHMNIVAGNVSGDREVEVVCNQACGYAYFKAMTEYLWGTEITRSSRALYSVSLREKLG